MPEVATLLPLLPSVEKIIVSPEAVVLLQRYPRPAVIEAVREQLDGLRKAILGGAEMGPGALSAKMVVESAAALLAESARRRLRRVINATGVVLHSNLGRALLAPSAADSVLEAARHSCTVEYDLVAGTRGDRDDIVETHLLALTGAEAATVVNNNAAAVLLLLNTLADGQEVLVSRGELVEIGGSFRIPDIMRKSGANLREVGTTNRTHLRDYADAVAPATAMFLKVHTSNYRVVGFTASVELGELRALADRTPGIIVAEDLGSGALVDLTLRGLGHEPLVADRLREGADIVCFSADKLLGGPQAGILVGRRDIMEKIRRNPLKRALRCDKLTLAALEETLRLYRFDVAPWVAIPTLAALFRPVAALEELGARAKELLSAALGRDHSVELVRTIAKVGSGVRPDLDLESCALAVRATSRSADELAAWFRHAEPPIIGRVEKDWLMLDLRMINDPSEIVPRFP